MGLVADQELKNLSCTSYPLPKKALQNYEKCFFFIERALFVLEIFKVFGNLNWNNRDVVNWLHK